MSVYSNYEVYPSSYDDEDFFCPFNFECETCEYDCDLTDLEGLS